MSRTYRSLRYNAGFKEDSINDIVNRHSTNTLYGYEVTKYQSILNTKDFKRVLILKYFSTDKKHFYQFIKPKWVLKQQERKLRRITKCKLNKIVSLEDMPDIPNEIIIPYYH